jgi:hypothetical protein
MKDKTKTAILIVTAGVLFAVVIIKAILCSGVLS